MRGKRPILLGGGIIVVAAHTTDISLPNHCVPGRAARLEASILTRHEEDQLTKSVVYDF